MQTAIIGIVELESSTNNKFVIHNQALAQIEAYGIASVISSTPNPPTSPTLGDFYLIYGTPTASWVSQENSLTVWNGTGWEFFPPRTGVRVKDLETGRELFYDGSNWIISGGERRVNYTVGADVFPRTIDSQLQVIDPQGTSRNFNLPLPDTHTDFIVVNDSDNLSANGNTVILFDAVNSTTLATLDDTTGLTSINASWSVTANKWVVWS